jgi:hypothetical protein
MQELDWHTTIGLLQLKVVKICQDMPNLFIHGMLGHQILMRQSSKGLEMN